MATPVHKLTTLHSLGQSLLVQLYNVRTFLTDPRIRPEFASPQHVKLAKTLTSKFPEVPPLDKLAGVDALTKGPNSQELMTQLEPHYFAFVDLVDFHDLALQVMTEIANDVPELKMEVNPDLMEMFMDLYVVWIQCVQLCGAIEERKLLLAFHSVLYATMHSGGKETNSTKVMQFMKDYSGGDHTIKRLWEALKPLGPRVVPALVSLFPNWIKIRNIEVLRNDGVLSLNVNPAKITLPSSQPIYEELLRAPKMNNWFYFGFLYSPEDVAANQAAQDTLRYVIADTYVAPLYRDVTIHLTKEWEELSSYKTKTVSMSKAKKSFKEGFADQTAKCAQSHKDRRVYVRQELFLLKCLLSDTPALIGPKFPLVLAALSMAKDELLWLFRNKAHNKSKSTAALYEDPFVPETIHLVLQLTTLLRTYKDYVIDYHVQYLKGADTTRLDEMINEARFKSSTDADVQTVLGWMIGWLRTAEAGRHFGDVRQKWAEVQTVFISAARSVPATIIIPVVERVQLIMQHTEIVDSFDDMVSEHASLRSLWYFRSELQLAFEKSIVDGSPVMVLNELAPGASSASASDGSSGGAALGDVTTIASQTDVAAANAVAVSPATNQFPLHCLTFLPIASQAVENATQYDPFEKDRLGQDAVLASLDVVRKVMDAVVKDLDVLSRYHLEFDLQLEGVKSVDAFSNKLNELTAGAAAAAASAAAEALANAQAAGADATRIAALSQASATAAAAAKRATEKVPVDIVYPGAESAFANRTHLASLRASFKHLWHLLSAVDEFGSILIYNTIVTPREFLVSRIKKLFKAFLERHRFLPADKAPFKDDQTVVAPSHLVRIMKSFANFIKGLDLYLTIDVDLLINQVLLKQVYSTSLGVTGGKLDWMTDKGFEYSDNIIKCVAKWYSDFFARRITNPSLNVVYSANRRGFVSKATGSSSANFKAEKYLDFVELTKLASVIGPYGVKIIDREVLRFVVSNMSTLLGALRTLRADLTELSSTYSQETTTNQVLKTLKAADLDSFIGSSIVIGNALAFRKLLYSALGAAAKKTVPHLHNAVSNAFHQYLRNTFMAVDFVGMDSMAQDAGVDVSIADQPLKVALLPLSTSDRALWDLLPAAYAASFLISTHWKDAIYNPSLEAFENNAHVLTHTISDLLINFKALSGEGNNDEGTIRDQLVKFLDISGTILLRALSSPKLDPKLVPKEFSSLFVFLDLFVDQCPLLSRAELEPILPYSILRSMWRSIYSKVGKGKSEELDL